METQRIEEGDLLAYLEGEPMPHVEHHLHTSAELRAELELLRRAHATYSALFPAHPDQAHAHPDQAHAHPEPDPQDMVDVVTGQASAAQQLRVAAYIRQNAAGRAVYDELQATFAAASTPPSRLRPVRLPVFTALPAGLGAGLRTVVPARSDREQAFVVAELQVQVTLRVIPRDDGYWAVEGYVTRQQHPAAGVQVRMLAAGARPRPRITDDGGFFRFARLRDGTYQMRVTVADGTVLIHDVPLAED